MSATTREGAPAQAPTGVPADRHVRLRRRRTTAASVAVAWLLTAVLALAAGWLGAERFQSPAQRAAQAAAPTPEPILATVARGTLSRDFSTNATVTASATQQVTLSDSGVVTNVARKKGERVSAGDVVFALNDRPRIALPGNFAFYRDLRPSDTGADVRQLQDGLRSAGFTISVYEYGRFGTSTAAAVRGLYADAEYSAPEEPVAVQAPVAEADAGGQATDESPSAPTLVVRADEIIVTEKLPAIIAEVPHVGASLGDGATITFLSGAARVSADVPSTVLTQIDKTTTGFVQAASGKRIPVRVARISEHDDGGTVVLEATGKEALPASGAKVLAVLTIEKVPGRALIVPSRAVAIDGSGVAHVLRQDGPAFDVVPVDVIGELEGQTAIRSKAGSDLTVADKVRVG